MPILWISRWVFNGKLQDTLAAAIPFNSGCFSRSHDPFGFLFYSDRQALGRQFVEISSATREQYYSAVARVRSFFAETFWSVSCCGSVISLRSVAVTDLFLLFSMCRIRKGEDNFRRSWDPWLYWEKRGKGGDDPFAAAAAAAAGLTD